MEKFWKGSVVTAKFGISCLGLATAIGILLHNVGIVSLDFLCGANGLKGKKD